jgi:hypothetical protein
MGSADNQSVTNSQKAADSKTTNEADNQSTAPKPAVDQKKTTENSSGGQMDPDKGSNDGKDKQNSGIKTNKANGDAWEKDVVEKQLPETHDDIRKQITIKSNGPSGVKVRADAVGTEKATGQIQAVDAKGSQTAPLTKNQKIGYPEIETHGGTVVGEGKAPYTGGTQIPPKTVKIVRKPDGTTEEVTQ